MTDEQWKLKITEDVATIRATVESIRERLPFCEKAEIRSYAKTSRRLIFLVLFTYVPLIITLFLTVGK